MKKKRGRPVKKKRGRKPLPADKRRDLTIVIRVSKKEKKEIGELCTLLGVANVSELFRQAFF